LHAKQAFLPTTDFREKMPLKLSLIAPKPPPNHKSVTIGFDLVFEPWFASAEGCVQAALIR
jgi:hypothetical protein